jgi:peptidase E
MTTPRILATSGGYVAGPVQQTARLGTMLLDALARTKKDRPRVCLVMTATGDPWNYYALSYDAFNTAGCDVTELKLFPQPSADPTERLASCDLVWVGGGSVANLLALWRLHGVDDAMREAWSEGVILGGVSAGSLCWHIGGTTDSFGPTLAPVTNGLALLPYANGVHYDSEAQRRPLLHQLLRDEVLPPLAYATDDHVGIWYEGIEATSVVADTAMASDTGPAAYRVELVNGEVVETRYGVGTNFS